MLSMSCPVMPATSAMAVRATSVAPSWGRLAAFGADARSREPDCPDVVRASFAVPDFLAAAWRAGFLLVDFLAGWRFPVAFFVVAVWSSSEAMRHPSLRRRLAPIIM